MPLIKIGGRLVQGSPKNPDGGARQVPSQIDSHDSLGNPFCFPPESLQPPACVL